MNEKLPGGPTVLTVILNWRTPEMSIDSAASAVREMEGIAGEIIIVDNDSQDGSEEKMRAEVEACGWAANNRVRVLQSGLNGGFPYGTNFGMRAGLSDGSRPDYCYALNSDAFADEGSIRVLLQYLEEHPETGFAGSYIHGEDGEPHQTSFRFPTPLSEFEGAVQFGPVSRLLKNKAMVLPVLTETCRVDWLAGASLMMRDRILQEIGMFDETFFLYFDDPDLCGRALKAGWPTMYVHESKVTHLGSVSTGMKEWKRVPTYWLDSRLHYFVKNHGWGTLALATFLQVVGGGLANLRSALNGKKRNAPERFIRDLVSHDLKIAFGRMTKGQSAMPVPKAQQVNA
ncbi:glycosyltransferase [Algicella marina]|uniref:Glycosyltransferase n=1 Tax=Algicella marina TaxID=2683284 RepID=A0A6P1SWG1_9RHOB|nr:glycosyltransferase family 2 protein [Algicella marina]QHQ34097.1 glycosyltransferase [Algicella marina]